MNKLKTSLLAAAAGVLTLAATGAQAQVRITEVAPWASGNAPYATDWFELTNFGSTAVSLSGWTMDDSSNGSAKVALAGITSIAAGESVIFTETAAAASFLSAWFGANAPASLKIGTYTGAGVGLSTGGDAVNIFNASGVLQANVVFGTADATSPYQTFDNAAGLNGVTISQLSVVGVNGAFVAANDAAEIGSPGRISAVPEPESAALVLAALAVVGLVARKRQA
ncbi:lamin tail domain-containing protein [Aquabacterium sp.]|uniref:lamin tail domain-containing protein n=1 Tax=Aquabacterium sp. TaxID=1872578 RepID=UPI0025B87B24|nr:lamin tail domain-containing protein [Aquabacterium sp.]